MNIGFQLILNKNLAIKGTYEYNVSDG